MENTNYDFSLLINEVKDKRIKYHDFYEVAAYLESVGWNDKRAASVYGFNNVFEMAQQIYDIINRNASASTRVRTEKINVRKFLTSMITNFLRGLIFALPMAISVVAMLTLRFSLWSYENLSTDLATSIAIGTILSFMTVGGFTQAIARRGFFYIILGYYNMARKITFSFIKAGYITIVVVALLMFLSSYVFAFFPAKMLAIAILYYVFLSSIWLSVTVMYILKKELVFTGLIAVGIGIVAVLFLILEVNIIIAQFIALIIVTIVSLLFVIYFFRVAELKMEKGLAPKMPKLSVTYYTVAPYFLYGFLYFTFLYVDRVMAWSSNDSAYMPFLLWFRGNYELGLDFALFTLMLPLGIIEVAVDSIMHQLEIEVKNYKLTAIDELNRLFRKKYMRYLYITIIVAIISGIGIYSGIMYVDANYSEVLRFAIRANPTVHFVLICAVIAYSLLSVGMMNAVMLFSLSQPKTINQALGFALFINVIVGFVFSRWFSWLQDHVWEGRGLFGVDGYAFAIIGLLAGSLVFAVIAIRAAKRVFNNLDYYLYAMS